MKSYQGVYHPHHSHSPFQTRTGAYIGHAGLHSPATSSGLSTGHGYLFTHMEIVVDPAGTDFGT